MFMAACALGIEQLLELLAESDLRKPDPCGNALNIIVVVPLGERGIGFLKF